VPAALALLVFSVNWAAFLIIISALPQSMSAVCAGCAAGYCGSPPVLARVCHGYRHPRWMDARR